jgi:hypothetical protein
LQSVWTFKTQSFLFTSWCTRIALKRILKFTWKQLRHFSV